MIKLVLCLRKKSGIDELIFREYWNNEFDSFVRHAGNELQSKRIAKSLTLHIDANEVMQQRQNSMNAFDGMIEFWLDEPYKGFSQTYTDKWKEQVDEVFRSQQSILDMQQSTLFFVEEKIIVEAQ